MNSQARSRMAWRVSICLASATVFQTLTLISVLDSASSDLRDASRRCFTGS